jgi:hypothetical protein
MRRRDFIALVAGGGICWASLLHPAIAQLLENRVSDGRTLGRRERCFFAATCWLLAAEPIVNGAKSRVSTNLHPNGYLLELIASRRPRP